MDWTPEKEAEFKRMAAERKEYQDALRGRLIGLATSLGITGSLLADFVSIGRVLDESGYHILLVKK